MKKFPIKHHYEIGFVQIMFSISVMFIYQHRLCFILSNSVIMIGKVLSGTVENQAPRIFLYI